MVPCTFRFYDNSIFFLSVENIDLLEPFFLCQMITRETWISEYLLSTVWWKLCQNYMASFKLQNNVYPFENIWRAKRWEKAWMMLISFHICNISVVSSLKRVFSHIHELQINMFTWRFVVLWLTCTPRVRKICARVSIGPLQVLL